LHDLAVATAEKTAKKGTKIPRNFMTKMSLICLDEKETMKNLQISDDGEVFGHKHLSKQVSLATF
jgi:hypothetical protein